MSFSVGQPEQTGLDVILQGLGQGAGAGLQQSLADFHKKQTSRKQLGGVLPLLKDAGLELSPEDEKMFLESGLEPEKLIPLAGVLGKQKADRQKMEASEKEVQKNKDLGQEAFNVASKMLKQNLSGIGIDPLTKVGVSRKGVQNRALFNTLRSKFESVLLPMVNKGTLAKQRFDYIMSLIPKADESQRAIGGKLYALGHELGFDTSVLEEIPWLKKGVEEIEGGKEVQGKTLEVGEKLSNLPSASEVPNGIIRKGNKRYISDGKTWKEMK